LYRLPCDSASQRGEADLASAGRIRKMGERGLTFAQEREITANDKPSLTPMT
jgi:hypothetical protein